VVSVIESGEERGIAYYVMDRVQGMSVRAMLTQTGSYAFENAARLVERVARIVHEVHVKGIVHRDLKPDNIMVGEQDDLRVVDFGIAAPIASPSPAVPRAVPPPTLGDADRLTSCGMFVGTIQYAAPERFHGEMGDRPEAEVFSLGAILWELLTSRWGREEWDMAVHGRLSAEPLQTAKVPEPLQQICLKALAAKPSKRYETAKDLAAALHSFVLNPTPDPEPTLWWPPALAGLAGAAGAFWGLVRLLGWPTVLDSVHSAAQGAWMDLAWMIVIVLAAGLGGLSLALTRIGWIGDGGPLRRLLHATSSRKDRYESEKPRQWVVLGSLFLALAGASLGGFVGVSTVGEHTSRFPWLALGAYLGVVLGACNCRAEILTRCLIVVPLGALLGGLAGWALAKACTALGGPSPGIDYWIVTGVLLAGVLSAGLAYPRSDELVDPPDLLTGAVWVLRLVGVLAFFGFWWRDYRHQDRKIDLGGAGVTALSTTGVSDVLLAGHADGTLHLVDLQTGRIRSLPDQPAGVVAVAVSADGRWVATAYGTVNRDKDNTLVSGNYGLRVYDAATHQEVWQFGEAQGRPMCLAFNPKHPEQLAVGHDRSCVLYDVALRKTLGPFYIRDPGHFTEKGAARAIAFAPDGSRVIIVPKGVNDVQLPPELYLPPFALFRPPIAHLSSGSEPIESVTFTADAQQIATASFAGVVRLWDAKTGRELRQFRNDAGHVRSLAVSRDNGRLLAATEKGVVLWDLETGEPLRRYYAGPPDGGASAAVFASNRYAVSGGYDRAIRVWRLPP
jgi:hypothetical protein